MYVYTVPIAAEARSARVKSLSVMPVMKTLLWLRSH